jgi:hypothetical protein
MTSSSVKWIQHWSYQPSAEQQMQTICGILATCPPSALQGSESVDASSWCVGVLPPDVTGCSVQQRGPDLWYHLPTPSLLCTESVNLSGTFIYLLMYLLTPRNTGLPEKLTGPQLVKKFHKLCVARRFITAFRRACHMSLPSARSIQSMPPPPTPLLKDPF